MMMMLRADGQLYVLMTLIFGSTAFSAVARDCVSADLEK